MNACDSFKALGDLTRLRILMLLLQQELCVCDILAVLRLPQSTVSRQLGILKSAGLVSDRRAGRWVHYRMQNSAVANTVRPYLTEHLAGQKPHCDDLAALALHREKSECRP